MGIKFACAECGYVLHVKSALAGKRGFCPKCQGRVDIPVESPPPSSVGRMAAVVASDTPEPVRLAVESPSTLATAVAAPLASTAPRSATPVPLTALSGPAGDPISENPEMQWYVVPPGAATPYGPATGTLFRSWIDEGRVTADSLVWRQDWKDWQPASSVLPQFRTPVPQALPPLPGNVVPRGQPVAADFVSPIAVPEAPQTAEDEVVDEQLAKLEKPRRAVKKPRDYTNILILVLAIGVIVVVPLMIYVLK